MVIGFVLIGSKPGSERDVYDAIAKIDGITDAHQLFGEYDILAKVRIDSSDIQDLSKVVENVRKVPGVLDTKTLPGIPGYVTRIVEIK